MLAAGWDNVAMFSSMSMGRRWSVLQVAIPLLFWLHLPQLWGITLPSFPGHNPAAAPAALRKKQHPEHEPCLTNYRDSPGLLLEACDSNNNGPHKAELLLNSQPKMNRHVYLVWLDSNMATAESFTSSPGDCAHPWASLPWVFPGPGEGRTGHTSCSPRPAGLCLQDPSDLALSPTQTVLLEKWFIVSFYYWLGYSSY